jgi:predicted MPP superfamily phosphohydrolase
VRLRVERRVLHRVHLRPVDGAVRVSAPRRARPVINAWRRRFIARVLGFTALCQLPAMALAAAWLHRGGGAWSTAWAASLALRDPAWLVGLVELPYAAYGTACFLGAPLAYAAVLGVGALHLAGIAAPGLAAVLGPLYAAMLVVGVWSVTAGRMVPAVRVRELAVPRLPAAFDGYRIAQLSDVHCGPYLPRWLYRGWCARALAQRPDMVALTGDYITSGGGYLDDVRDLAAALRAPDGVFACMGNHDYFGVDEAVAEALAAGGARVLRNAHATVARGGARLHVAAVDDRWTKRDDAAAALRGVPDGEAVVMLAHDPASFGDLAARGVDVVLSGHTHAGQFALPFAGDRVNLARVMHRYTAGVYREGAAVMYVHRGMGTSGPPSRFGARPEIAVLVLRRAQEF